MLLLLVATWCSSYLIRSYQFAITLTTKGILILAIVIMIL